MQNPAEKIMLLIFGIFIKNNIHNSERLSVAALKVTDTNYKIKFSVKKCYGSPIEYIFVVLKILYSY